MMVVGPMITIAVLHSFKGEVLLFYNLIGVHDGKKAYFYSNKLEYDFEVISCTENEYNQYW